MLNPEFPNKSTGIINGQSSGILNWNDIAYPQMYDLYQTLLSNFWKAQEINMQDDIKQWDSLSSGRTRCLFTNKYTTCFTR